MLEGDQPQSMISVCANKRFLHSLRRMQGKITTPHGELTTPLFMPVGTLGAMKGIEHRELLELGAEILLCNTYHLHLQPGEDVVTEAGGLHTFLGWDRPIITDSGGFQVFSLRSIRDVTDEGVHFRSHLNGAPLFLGPKEATEIQHKLGSDILMCFDQCPPSTAPRAEMEAAVERTIRWARICKETHEQLKSEKEEKSGRGGRRDVPDLSPLLFGIVQGGLDHDLRKRCTRELIAMNFDGYAIGGLAVGETEAEMYDILDLVCPLLPKDKPRYLMGVGRIEQMKTAIAKGIDMFDCVLPMREARHGTIYLSNGEKIRTDNSTFIHDHSVIDPDSPSPLSRKHTKSYLCHLMRSGERYGETIACMQNLAVTLKAMAELRSQTETLRN